MSLYDVTPAGALMNALDARNESMRREARHRRNIASCGPLRTLLRNTKRALAHVKSAAVKKTQAMRQAVRLRSRHA